VGSPNQLEAREYDPTDGLYDFFLACAKGTLRPTDAEREHYMRRDINLGQGYTELSLASWTPTDGMYAKRTVDVRALFTRYGVVSIRVDIFSPESEWYDMPDTSFKLRKDGIAWINDREALPNGSTKAIFPPNGREHAQLVTDQAEQEAARAIYEAANSRIRQLATAMLQDVVFAPASEEL
jgi:hypothetical protein